MNVVFYLLIGVAVVALCEIVFHVSRLFGNRQYLFLDAYGKMPPDETLMAVAAVILWPAVLAALFIAVCLGVAMFLIKHLFEFLGRIIS